MMMMVLKVEDSIDFLGCNQEMQNIMNEWYSCWESLSERERERDSGICPLSHHPLFI